LGTLAYDIGRRNPYLTTTPKSIDGLTGVARRDGFIGLPKGIEAPIGLETSNSASSSIQQQEMMSAPLKGFL
jgi:hypothetical protein